MSPSNEVQAIERGDVEKV